MQVDAVQFLMLEMLLDPKTANVQDTAAFRALQGKGYVVPVEGQWRLTREGQRVVDSVLMQMDRMH